MVRGATIMAVWLVATSCARAGVRGDAMPGPSSAPPAVELGRPARSPSSGTSTVAAPTDAGAEPRSSPWAAASSTSGLPLVQNLGDVRRYAGQRVEVQGRYEVTPVPASKALQPACIVLADGTRLVRSYRPVLDELRFDGLRVVVVGKAYPDANQSPDVQQVMAPHVQVESLSLHPLVSPYSPGETEVRTPPTVSSARELEQQRDRWVQLFGVLESAQAPPKDPDWATAVLALPDGARIELSTVWAARYRPLVGQQVSVIARVAREQRGSGLPQADPSPALCRGHVERCGMDGRY